MSTDLVVIGAGGFGRETLDVIEAAASAPGSTRRRVIGVVDDSPSAVVLERLEARGIRWLGTIREWLESGRRAEYVIGIGDPIIRARIDAEFVSFGCLSAPALVHPAAAVGSLTRLEPGVVVCAGAQISTNVFIGRHSHVNPNATIGHDVVIGSHVSINPGAIVSGDVEIGDRTLLGAGAVILQGLRVGDQTVVGAAACVTRAVPNARTVKGVPAR